MRDIDSVPASGPKRLTAYWQFTQKPEVMLQAASTAIQKMRRTDTGALIWALDPDYGYDETSLWVRASAPVLHAFRGGPESVAGPSPTTLALVCSVASVSYQEGDFAQYTLDFTEHMFGFEGGRNEDLVLATCARIVFDLVEKKLLRPDEVSGFWQMPEGSWNYPWLVEATVHQTATAFLGTVLNQYGVLTISPDYPNRLAWIRSCALPNQQQIAASGLRLDGIYKYATPDVAAGNPRYYVRFHGDGGLEFLTAQSDAQAERLLRPDYSVDHAQSLYQVIGSTVRFPLWGPGWTMDFQGSIAGEGLQLYGAHRTKQDGGESFWAFVSPQAARVQLATP